MTVKDIYSALTLAVGADNVFENELLSKHTTFRIGGPARYFLTPDSICAIRKAILICKEYNIDSTKSIPIPGYPTQERNRSHGTDRNQR